MRKKIIILAVIIILIIVVIVVVAKLPKNDAIKITSDDVEAFDTSDIRDLSLQYEDYIGKQKGETIAVLIDRLIKLASGDEYDVIPGFKISDQINAKNDKVADAKRPTNKEESNKYINNLNNIKKKLEATHDYIVEVDTDTDGIIREYILCYY